MEVNTKIRLFQKDDGKQVFRMTLDLIFIYVIRIAPCLYLWERRLWTVTLVGVLQMYALYMSFNTGLLVPACCIGFYLIFVNLVTCRETKNAPDFHGPDAFVEHWSHTDIGNYLWVIEKGDKVIGPVAIERQSCNTAYLSRMVIVPECRGQGYSKKLLHHAVAYCKIHGYATMELMTSSIQKEAYNLYERCGFKRYQTLKYYVLQMFNLADGYMYRLLLDQTQDENLLEASRGF